MTASEAPIATLHKRKSGGHYARVMGTLWRHLKPEKCGDAALGLLVRIWSFCADNGRHVLSERDMAVLLVRDKNGPRKLKALLDAKLLDRVEGGYSPHDWLQHNPGLASKEDAAPAARAAPDREPEPVPSQSIEVAQATRNETRTRGHGEENATGNVKENATGNVSKPPEEKRALTLSLSRPKTQDPAINTTGYASSPGAAAPDPGEAGSHSAAPALPGVSKLRSKTKALVALERALANEMGKRSDVAPGLSRSLGQKASQRVAQHAQAAGCTLDASAALLAASWAERGNGNAWKLCDVPFNAANAPRQHAVRPRMAPATTEKEFADADVDAQLEKLRLLK